MFSIFNVCKKFDLTNQFKFIIKVSGRYFIPDFEKVFEGKNMSEYKALRQNKSDRCEVAGARSDFADTLFDCCYCIHHIESTYKQRIEAVDEKEVLEYLDALDGTVVGLSFQERLIWTKRAAKRLSADIVTGAATLVSCR